MVLFFISCKNDKDEKGRILIVVSNTADMGDQEKHFAGNKPLGSGTSLTIFLFPMGIK